MQPMHSVLRWIMTDIRDVTEITAERDQLKSELKSPGCGGVRMSN
ncbi:hypothetical protein PSYPI_46739, partial [Pseudomonas syringae pv. pisi str. 1704B]